MGVKYQVLSLQPHSGQGEFQTMVGIHCNGAGSAQETPMPMLKLGEKQRSGVLKGSVGKMQTG